MSASPRGGKKWLILLALPALLLGLLAWQWSAILQWHYVRSLAGAEEGDREACAERVAALDLEVLPRLLTILRDNDARAVANVEAALVSMLRRWGADDPRGKILAEELLSQFNDLSVEGQYAALRVPLVWLGMSPVTPAPAAVTTIVGQFLSASTRNAELRSRALLLAQALLLGSIPGQWTELCKEQALAGLKDADAETRLRAVHVLQQLARVEPQLLAESAELLRDSAVEVRCAALIAVGASRDAVADEELLPLLHDADAEVRRLCEAALRSRGLGDSHLLLARLISDSRPGARLQVVSHLSETDNLEPGVWLRRLSQDTSPAVRAAAVRAMYYQTHIDLRDRIQQMAADDPSPTVRQLAEHYLRRPPLRED
ncbi:MAG: hypothetical protein FJ271_25000 [Planctomycetes bacterium]|nr:hypothetical protein [Planctomycetota bacterium]